MIKTKDYQLLYYCFFLFFIVACSDDSLGNKSGSSIQGTITEKGQGIASVSILVDNQATAQSNFNGDYRADGFVPGTYVIKPFQTGRLFFPSETSVTMADQDIKEIDFLRLASDQLVHRESVWEMFRMLVYTVKTNTATSLQLDLAQNALWYHENQGGLLYRMVTGDFILTATVNAVRKSDNTQPAACNVCLGGLMVRNPITLNGENYIHLVTGFTPNGLGVETKSTVNSFSTYDTNPDGYALHDLRLERVKSSFKLYKKSPVDSNWVLVATYNRTDLPETSSVGVNIYTSQTGAVADLSLIYSNITIE